MWGNLNIRSEFVKSVMVLTSGTVIAQIASYAVTPVITRLFTTEDFGEFGIFMRVVAFLTAIGTARYELTIPLPKLHQHAFLLFRLSLKIALITTVVSLLTGLAVWAFYNTSEGLLAFVLLMSGTTFFMIFKNIGTNWAIRNKVFRRISAVNITTSVATNTFKLAAGFWGWGAFGLIGATFVGTAIGVFWFIKDFLRSKLQFNVLRSARKTRWLSRHYREFPRVNLPHTLIDTTRELGIAFFLTFYLSTATFGAYDLSFKMLKIPLLLIGTSISQVLLQKASEKFTNGAPLYPLVRRVVIILLALSIVPFGVVFFAGTPLFAFVFGSEWEISGAIAEALAPWLMLNFVASTISLIPSVIRELKWFFWVGVATSIIQLSLFGFFDAIAETFEYTSIDLFEKISWIMTVFFMVVIVWELRLIKRSDERREG
ncbi:MAG: lipopolysaccharide biosynthesis protein [Bacteroidota bacterium]